jgi:hypothetical protein
MLAVAGWGSTVAVTTSTPVIKVPAILRAVEVQPQTDSHCAEHAEEMTSGPRFVAGTTLCAGGTDTRDTCQGDSGGPIFARFGGGVYAAAGIVSWGHGCGQPGHPAYYTNLANPTYRAFIDSTVRASQSIGELVVSPTAVTVAEGGRVVINVGCTHVSHLSPGSVELRLVSSTATVGRDVDFLDRIVSWGILSTVTQQISFTVNADAFTEPDEVFYVQFGDARGLYIPSNMSAVVVTIAANIGSAGSDPDAGALGPHEPQSLAKIFTGSEFVAQSPTSDASNHGSDGGGELESDDDDRRLWWAWLLIIGGCLVAAAVIVILRRRQAAAAAARVAPGQQVQGFPIPAPMGPPPPHFYDTSPVQPFQPQQPFHHQQQQGPMQQQQQGTPPQQQSPMTVPSLYPFAQPQPQPHIHQPPYPSSQETPPSAPPPLYEYHAPRR